MNIIKKICEHRGWKRKTAGMLCLVMVTQLLLGGTLPTMAEPKATGGSTIIERDMTAKGHPGAYFSRILLKMLNTVTDSNSLHTDMDVTLNHQEMNAVFEELVDAETIKPPTEFTTDEAYEAYLDSPEVQKVLEPLTFSWTYSPGLFSVDAKEERQDIIASIDGKDTLIGTATIQLVGGKPTFSVELKRLLYYKQDVTIQLGFDLGFADIYKPGTAITEKSETGGADIALEVDGSGGGDLKDNGYELKKGVLDRANSDRQIVYTIAAKASPSDAGEKLKSEVEVSSDSQSEIPHSSPSELGRISRSKSERTSPSDSEYPEIPEDTEILDGSEIPDSESDSFFESIFRSNIVNAGGLEVASSSNLYGKKILDKIPTDLEVLKVEAMIGTSGAWTELQPETGYTLDPTTGELCYVIPTGVEGFLPEAVIRNADLRITTKLSDAVFNKYAQGGLPYEEVFPNRATMKDPEDQLVQISNEVRPFIEFAPFLTKNGKSVDATNQKFTWTLTANANFSSNAVQAWIIDHIEDIGETHNYDLSAGITIDGDSFAMEKMGHSAAPAIPTAEFPYEVLTSVAQLEQLFTYCGETVDMANPLPTTGAGAKTVYVYDYTTQDANGKSRTDAVLLIPLNQDYVNQKLNITYQTQVAKDMTDPGNMDQGVNLMMKNEAKSVWRWPSGTGTGSWDEHGGITIDKDLAGSYHVLSKNAWNSNHQSTYDEATNTLTWNFKINQVGADLTDAVLTDVFDSKKQLLLLKDGTPDLQLKDFDGNDGPLIKEHSKAGNDPRYYEITTSGDSDTFTLHLGAIGAKAHYTFSLAVRVLDVTMNSEEAKATVHNEAKLDYKVGDKTGSSTVSADADVVNTILKKTRVPVVEGSQVYYDYANHTVKWKTTVNPKHFAMGVPTLTDLLPEGTCLEDISVTRVRGNQPGETKDFAGSGAGDARIWNPVSFGDGETILVLQQKATPDSATPMFTQREAVFAFTNIAGDNTNASYEFTYTTSLDEDYRKKYLTGNQGVTLMNEVKLSNETTTIVASDKAPNKIAPAGMTKNGQYVSYKEPNSYSYPYMDGDTKKTKEMDVDVIHWTIFVNKTHADLNGVSIEDTVADFLELVPASLKVESIPTLTASGEIPEATPGAPSDITDVTNQFLAQPDSRIDETGFSLKIPAAWKSTTLRITCDTVLVDSANATTMKNAVSLKGPDLDSSITSNIPKGAKDFRIANYAHAKGVYYAGIQKVSSNESGVGKFPLKGAKFQLEKMVLKAGGTSTDKADWEAAASPKAKIKTGNRKGNANFLFLEADTLYRLTETVPPAGYEKLNTEWYLVPKLTSKTADYFPTPASGTTEWEMILPETGGQHITKVIENKTSGTGGEVSFTKKNGTGSGAKGLAGAKFSIEHIQGQLKFDPVISDAEGKITITGLDQTSKLGKYKVKEIEAPVGYRLDSKEFFVTVAYDAQKGYTTEVTGLGGTAPDYVVVNEPLVPELVFSKVDQNGDAIGSDRMQVSFAVTGNAQANLEGADLDGTAVTVPGTVSTDQEGKVKIRLPYGSYTLTETLDSTESDKLQDSSKLAKLYVKVEQIAKSAPEAPASGQTKVSISTDANFAEGSTRTITKADTAVKTVPFDFSDAKTAAAYLAVTNDLNYGCVQVHKVLGERDNNGALQAVTKDQNTIPIQGAKFDIYHKNTDQSKGTLVMTLTTDTAGKFPIQKNGSYLVDGKEKFLLCGDYILQEKSVPAGYVLNKTAYPFTIAPGTFASGSYVPSTVYIDSETSATPGTTDTTYFMNEPIRGTVKLQKVDQDNAKLPLNDAQFAVYVKDTNTKVANLIYNDNQGIKGYQLSLPGDGGWTSPEKSQGLSYLRMIGDGTSVGGAPRQYYALLAGSYDLKETTAPTRSDGDGGNAYPAPDSAKVVGSFTIDRDKTEVVKLNNKRDIKNKIIQHSFSLQKMVEDWVMTDNSGKTNGYKSANGFQFTLSGTAVNGATTPAGDQTTPYVVSGTTSGIGAASGTIKFQNIPVGTYTLSETRVAPEYQFGLDNTLEAVTKMADIQVKVTAAGIAFGRLDVPLTPTTDETKKAGTDSVSGAVDEQVLTVYNKLKIGSISGTKVGVGNQKDGKVDLAGAKFGLYKKGSDALYATTTAVPPNVITFTGVPFGDYDVQEIDAPTGYVRSDTKYPVTVQAESPATEIDADTTKPGAQAVENQAILKTITLLKVDQNGAPLGSDRLNTGFTITKTDTINPTIPAAIYTVPTSVGNDKDGKILITNLAYGTYKVEETLDLNEKEKLDEPDVTLPEFYIKVEAGDDAQAKTHTKITVSTQADQDDFGTSTGAITRTITQNNSDTTPYDFANLSSSATLFAIENRLKYGTIAIHKIGAEKNNSGQATSYTEQGAIPEVTFEIYRDTDGDGKWLPIDLVLTLKTDAKGHFPKTVDGKYTDANSNVDNQILPVALLAGDYVLHEKNAPTGYAMLKTDIKFRMTNKAQVVTFTYDGKTGAATTDANLSTKPFYNLIPRGTVSFQKVAADKPETVVHDAVFALVSKDSGANQGKAVAFVTEVVDPQTGKTGTYRLTETTEALKTQLPSGYSYVEKLGTIPYVREDASQVGVFKVLSGAYALLELETGEAYQKPTNVVVVDSLTVEDEKDTVLGTGGKITNALKTADITIQKQIEAFELSTPKIYQDHTKTPAGKFEFTLAGKTVSGRDFTETHVVGAAGFRSGEVQFQDIPVGSYTLKETAHPDNYVALDPNGIAVTIAVDAAGKAVVSYAGGTATPDPYIIQNDVYRNTIYAKKVTTLGQQDYPVAGAVFGLFDSADRELARATSDGDGNLKFADVPCLVAPDTYYVKEISAPSGYTPDETHYVIAVTQQQVALSDGTAAGMAITESKPLLIQNAATLVSVKLKKINQNGAPIKGSEIPLNFTLTEKAVGGDRFKVTASNAEDGSVTFSGLRYGTYQLTEAASDHVTGEEQVTAEIEVSKGSGDQTKVSVTYNHQTRSMEQAAANPDFDFTADAALAMVNEVDYGLVQINKIVGSVNRDGSLTPVWEGNHVKPLAGAKFQVYVDTNRNGTADPGEYAQDKAVLTMVTGVDGSFLMDEENRYLNSGLPQNYRLLYGEFYLLREISVSQGLYAASTAIYPFDMKKLTQTEQKLYVGADPKDVKITLGSMDGGTGDIVAKADAALIFPNGAAHRGSVKLVKQDQEDPDITLSGAEFDVYTDSGIRIGRLTDEHERGSYELAMGGTGYVKEDASGQRYLHDEGGTIMLLPGSYYIVETKAPKGYVLPSNAERWYFVMNNQADVIVTNPDLKTDATGTTAKALENHIARHHLAVQKYVQEALHTVTYHTANASDPLTGIELQLEGFTINQEHYRVTKNLAQMMNAAGIVTFEDIPSGTYTLTELHVPEQYQVPKPMQVVVDSDGIRMDDGERIGGAVRLNNDLKRGSIRGMKKASGDKPLAGAMIGLFPAGTTEFSEANLYAGLISVSDATGMFRFQHVLCGDYVIAELKAPSGYVMDKSTSYFVHVREQDQVVTIGDKHTGAATPEPDAELILINHPQPAEDDDDPQPTKPIKPTNPTKPTEPIGPGIPPKPTEPVGPAESTSPVEPTTPAYPDLPELPPSTNDPGKPDLPPGTIIEIRDPQVPTGPPLYRGPYDPNKNYPELPPGEYVLVTIDEEGAPLADFFFTIDEMGIPLAAVPKAGDSSVSGTTLVVLMLISLTGVGLLWKRKKEDYE